jgi:hypothetical protein
MAAEISLNVSHTNNIQGRKGQSEIDICHV